MKAWSDLPHMLIACLSAGNPGSNGVNVAEAPETAKMRRDLHNLRAMLLRVAMRLGLRSDQMVQQVQYRLDLAERIRLPIKSGVAREQLPSVEAAATAAEAGAGAQEDLPLEATILVLGIVGVGKSATINSLLGLEAAPTSPFSRGTQKVSSYRNQAAARNTFPAA